MTMQKMLIAVAWVALICPVAGCGGPRVDQSWQKPVQGPHGSQVYVIPCGARIDLCYERSDRLCPRGYVVVDRISGVRYVRATTALGKMVYDYDGTKMVVECRDRM